MYPGRAQTTGADRSHQLRILCVGTRGQIFPGHFQNVLGYFQNHCSRCYSWNASSPCTLLPGNSVLVLSWPSQGLPSSPVRFLYKRKNMKAWQCCQADLAQGIAEEETSMPSEPVHMANWLPICSWAASLAEVTAQPQVSEVQEDSQDFKLCGVTVDGRRKQWSVAQYKSMLPPWLTEGKAWLLFLSGPPPETCDVWRINPGLKLLYAGSLQPLPHPVPGNGVNISHSIHRATSSLHPSLCRSILPKLSLFSPLILLCLSAKH